MDESFKLVSMVNDLNKYWDYFSRDKLDTIKHDEWRMRNDVQGAVENKELTAENFTFYLIASMIRFCTIFHFYCILYISYVMVCFIPRNFFVLFP